MPGLPHAVLRDWDADVIFEVPASEVAHAAEYRALCSDLEAQSLLDEGVSSFAIERSARPFASTSGSATTSKVI